MNTKYKNALLKICCLFAVVAGLTACGGASNQEATGEESGADSTASNVVNDWKLGVAFWTYHTFTLPDVLAYIDSSNVDYVEGTSTYKGGAPFNDTILYQLSAAGVEKYKKMISDHNLKMESIYLGGDNTVESWDKQFKFAKDMGVEYVVGEPPISMLDQIDSLAGAYDLKLALHEHWKGVSQYWNPDTVLAAIEGHENLGACADLGHWPKSGIVPLEAVKKLEGHIIGVHLKDIAAYDNPELKDVPVGTGVVDFPAIFAELKRQGFDGNIYIERDAEDQPSNLPSVLNTVKYYDEQVGKLK